MASIAEALAIARQHHEARRLDAAALIYRQILRADADQVEALHRLGLIVHQQGNHSEAVELLRRAVAVDGTQSPLHFHLATVYSALNNHDQAMASLQQALRLDPQFAEAHANLGALHKLAGRLDDALTALDRAIELQPQLASAHTTRGNTLADLGRFDEAIAANQAALECRPNHAPTYNNLGNALRRQGQSQAALACFRRALELNPRFPLALVNLGALWQDLGQFREAVACCQRALEIDPHQPGALNNLGNAWLELGDATRAVACYQQALAMRPDWAECHCNLGRAWRAMGNLEAAADAGRRAIELKPDYAVAWNNLAAVWKDQGRHGEAIACYRQALAIQPDYAEAHSNYLCALRYLPETTPADLHRVAADFDRHFAAPLRIAWPSHGARPVGSGTLRLGFVSPNFCFGPTGYFLIRALEHLDRRRYEVVCYSDRQTPDAMTARFRTAASEWHDVFGLSDGQLADRIRADRIDILFDLAGHGPHNRLLVFARQPAPLQVTWLDSVGTTGLSAIDYLLADPYQVAPGTEPWYAERVLRLPETYVCYEPPAECPPVGPLPALARGHVTFGSFNNPAKFSPGIIELWAAILRRIPAARLVLKYRGLNDPAGNRYWRELFARLGTDLERVEFQGASPHAELLTCYQQVDVALDPIYNGGLTTCEALWMGVPVVTCPGDTFPRRHALSHLSNVGLTETIARTPDEYVELAVRLASDRARLADIRASLRERMAASPLCDGGRFAENVQNLLNAIPGR